MSRSVVIHFLHEVKRLQFVLESLNLRLDTSRLCRLDEACQFIGLLDEERCDTLVVSIVIVSVVHRLDLVLSIIRRERRVSLHQLVHQVVFTDASLGTPEEELSGRFPSNGFFDDTLGLHASSLVMQVSEFSCGLQVDGLQGIFPCSNLCLDCDLVLFEFAHFKLSVEEFQLRIQSVHNLELVGQTEFDFSDTSWLQDTTARVRISIHFHFFLR
mmetsp:Transcript_16682/g.31738  ORF Transcript_16682/g.31738 Transcript_16682/m.31738 type:complete len:214 (-) Transcript_16682:1430-2071(-)